MVDQAFRMMVPFAWALDCVGPNLLNHRDVLKCKDLDNNGLQRAVVLNFSRESDRSHTGTAVGTCSFL
jgi:hypothetical protein